MKKFIAFILLLTFLFVLFSGCEKDDISDTILENNDLGLDFAGENMIVVQDDIEENPFRYLFMTEFGDLAQKRIDEIEQAYNFTLSFKYGGWDAEIVTFATTSSMSGSYIGDIYYSSLHNTAGRIAAGGGLIPLTDVEDIINYEDSEKWGGANFLETAMHASIPYAVAPMYWPMKQPSTCYVLVFNHDMTPQMGINDPREYLEQKNWTWETYEELLSSLPSELNGNPFSGMVESAIQITKMAIYGNGVEAVTQTESGYQINIDSIDAIAGMEWAQTMYRNYTDKYYMGLKTTGSWEERVQPVIDGNAYMVGTATWVVLDTISYKINNFGLMPYPVGPKGEQGVWPGTIETMDSVGILTNTKDVEYSAYIIDAIFEPLENYETIELRDAYLEHSVLHDPRDVALWRELGKNAKFTYWTVGGDDSWYTVANLFFTQTPAQYLQANKKVLEKVVEEHIAPNLEYMNSHK